MPSFIAQPKSPDLMPFEYVTGKTKQKARWDWYRGEHCNFQPTQKDLRGPGGFEAYVLHGWAPKAPFVRRDHVVTAFGSCFAEYVSEFLRQQHYGTGERMALTRGFDASAMSTHVIRYGAGMASTFAMRQQFEWAYEGATFHEQLWHGAGSEGEAYDESIRAATRQLFDATDVFILSVGLAEVWCNAETNEVFWRAIPRTQFDPKKHTWRLSSVEENRANLLRIHDIIRRHRPDASLVITVSPIPLVATFRPVSCVTASCVSKSILRVAVDELMRAHPDDDKLFYWPGYEIVKEYFTDPYQPDNRHPKPFIVERVMDEFARHFLVDPYPRKKLEKLVGGAYERLARFGLGPRVAELFIRQGIYEPAEIAELPVEMVTVLLGDADAAARLLEIVRSLVSVQAGRSAPRRAKPKAKPAKAKVKTRAKVTARPTKAAARRPNGKANGKDRAPRKARAAAR